MKVKKEMELWTRKEWEIQEDSFKYGREHVCMLTATIQKREKHESQRGVKRA